MYVYIYIYFFFFLNIYLFIYLIIIKEPAAAASRGQLLVLAAQRRPPKWSWTRMPCESSGLRAPAVAETVASGNPPGGFPLPSWISRLYSIYSVDLYGDRM